MSRPAAACARAPPLASSSFAPRTVSLPGPHPTPRIVACRFWAGRNANLSEDSLPVVEAIAIIPPPAVGNQYAYQRDGKEPSTGGGIGGSGRGGDKGTGGGGGGSGQSGGSSSGQPGRRRPSININARIQAAILFFCWFSILTAMYTFIRKILIWCWRTATNTKIPNWSNEVDDSTEVGVMPDETAAWLEEQGKPNQQSLGERDASTSGLESQSWKQRSQASDNPIIPKG